MLNEGGTITAIGLTKKTVENDIRKSKILDCYSDIDNPVKSTGMSIVHVINTRTKSFVHS